MGMHLPPLKPQGKIQFSFSQPLSSTAIVLEEESSKCTEIIELVLTQLFYDLFLQTYLSFSEVFVFIFFNATRSKWKRLGVAWELNLEQCCEDTFVLLGSEVSPPPTLWGGSCDVWMGWEKNQYAWQSGVVPMGPSREISCVPSSFINEVATSNQDTYVLKQLLKGRSDDCNSRDKYSQSPHISPSALASNSLPCSFYPDPIIVWYVWEFGKKWNSG